MIAFDEDLPGFGLRLRAGGSAVWVAQYRVGPKQRRVTLGRLATLDPDQARRAARAVLAKAGLGQDAQAERREQQAKAAVTFGAVAQLYLTRAVAGQRPKTLAERQRYLLRHWKPFHPRPVDEVHRRDVAGRLHVVAEVHGPVASNRARAALSAFYAWAISQGLAQANPVVGTVRAGLERPRERVLSAEEIRALWRAAGTDDHGRIVKLLLLTGQRRGEVAGLASGELDLDRAVWSLPAGRTKNGLPHDVPLSTQAVALLETTPRRAGRDLLFGQAAGPFAAWAKAKERLNLRIARRRAEARLGRPPRAGRAAEHR